MSVIEKVTVVIKSFNRPKYLQNLLNDLERDGKRLKALDVRVFDDGSTEDMETCFQFCREKGWSVERFGFNHGKKKAWVLHNKIMADLRNVPADHLLVFLDDDSRLCKDFFNRLVFYWSEAENFKAISLQLMIDSLRAGQSCWTGYAPTEVNEYLRQIQWIDGSYACTKELLEMLQWTLEPISESRWIKNPSLSTGVGQQISCRLYSLNKLMLQSSESLVVHVDGISFYNFNEDRGQTFRTVNFIDGDEDCDILETGDNVTPFSTETERISVTMSAQESESFTGGISIIIPAYRTANLLEECVNSILQQTYQNYEILIGVDNCRETLYEAIRLSGRSNKIKVYNAIKNVGPYVIKNTLLEVAKNDNILFFDSDDVLMPDALEIFSEIPSNTDMVRFRFLDFEDKIENSKSKFEFFAKGNFFLRKRVFEKAGGFLNWKCAADYEFEMRTKGHFLTKEINRPLYYRRVRVDSLTKCKRTGINSQLRNFYHSKIKEVYWDPCIEPVTVEIEDINKIIKGIKDIPKLIHQIWIGPKKPPIYMKEWAKMNPTYEYILWDDEKVEQFGLENIKLYNDFGNRGRDCYSGRSDVVRYEVLKKYGGIYLDADCNPKRPLDGCLLKNELFTCYLNEKERPGRLASGIIGCIPNHPLMCKCVSTLKGVNVIKKSSFKTVGPVFFTRMARDFDIKVYPSYYFVPHFYSTGYEQYDGNFRPYCDHEWGTTKGLYEL